MSTPTANEAQLGPPAPATHTVVCRCQTAGTQVQRHTDSKISPRVPGNAAAIPLLPTPIRNQAQTTRASCFAMPPVHSAAAINALCHSTHLLLPIADKCRYSGHCHETSVSFSPSLLLSLPARPSPAPRPPLTMFPCLHDGTPTPQPLPYARPLPIRSSSLKSFPALCGEK